MNGRLVRFAVALAVVAVAFSAAVFVHQRQPGVQSSTNPLLTESARQQPSWRDPLAVLIAIGGAAAAVGIVALRGQERGGA